MVRRNTHWHGYATTAIALAAMLALHAPARAQSANDFKLSPGNETQQAPPVSGPVDPDFPVPVNTSPEPARQPAPPPRVAAPEATPPPVVIPPVSRTAEDAPVPARVAPRPPAERPEPVTGSSARPVTSTEVPVVAPPEIPTASAEDAPVVEPASATRWIWWLAGGALLLLLAAGIVPGLRRKGTVGDDAAVAPAANAAPPVPEKGPPPVLHPVSPPPSVAPDQIELVFEPRSLTMALINARLAYRLSLRNRAGEALGSIGIAGDIISAHGSLSLGEQLSFAAGEGEPLHRIASLAPGESVLLSGELQMPVAAIRPIHSGDASLFLPLARLRITMTDGDQSPLETTRIFIIGESPQQPGQRLGPLRIDLGQRTFANIGQREIAAAA